jgi:hypothetical protein
MTLTRRTVFNTAFAAAVVAGLPANDGIALTAIAHPEVPIGFLGWETAGDCAFRASAAILRATMYEGTFYETEERPYYMVRLPNGYVAYLDGLDLQQRGWYIWEWCWAYTDFYPVAVSCGVEDICEPWGPVHMPRSYAPRYSNEALAFSRWDQVPLAVRGTAA